MKRNTVFLCIFCFTILPIDGLAMQSSRLLEQLANPRTTVTAEQQLEMQGDKDEDISMLLSEKLPSLIENTASLPVLYQMANLAGKLRVRSTVPALCKRLEQDNLVFMSQTFYQSAQLANDPIARALVSIGDPSVEMLTKVLQSTSPRARIRAAKALKLLATPDANTAIKSYQEEGKDPRVLAVFQ